MNLSINSTHLNIVSDFFLKDQLREPSTFTEICDQTKLPENIVLETLNSFKRVHFLSRKIIFGYYNESTILAFFKVTESETDIQNFIDNPEREISPLRAFYRTITNPFFIKGRSVHETSLINKNWNLLPEKIDRILTVLEEEGTIERQSGRVTIIKPERLKELEDDYNKKTDQELRDKLTDYTNASAKKICENYSPPPSALLHLVVLKHPMPRKIYYLSPS